MAKVPEYTKNAINRYNAKFDRIAVNLPKGTKEEIKELTGQSCNAYISALVLDDLKTKRAAPKPKPEEPEEPKTQGISHFWEENEELPF